MTQFTNKAQEQVKEFHQAFGHPVGDKPTAMKLERAKARSNWSGEEIVEFLHASSDNQAEFKDAFAKLLVGLREAYQKQSDKPFPQTEEERIIAQADAVTDRLYFTFGDVVEIGIDIQPVFDIVHDANMSKLFVDEMTGEKYAKYDETGKVMKSPEFWSPESKIEEEVKRQLEVNTNSFEPSDKAKLEGIVEEKPKRKTTRKKKEVEVVETTTELVTVVEPVETIELTEVVEDVKELTDVVDGLGE